jgi:AcrR family transcriptional regulator
MGRNRINFETLLSVALEIVDTDGPSELTLSNVAAGLGVRPSALYTHVDGVDGLRDVVAIRARTNLAESIQTSAVGVAGADAVQAIALAYRTFAQRHPGQYWVTITNAGVQTEGQSGIHEVLEAVFAAGGLPDSEARANATSAHASLHGFVSMEANGAVGEDAQFTHLVQLLAGLCQPHLRRST